MGNEFRHVTEEEYKALRKLEKPYEEGLHPCDHWDSSLCMCRGACSCHWVNDNNFLLGKVRKIIEQPFYILNSFFNNLMKFISYEILLCIHQKQVGKFYINEGDFIDLELYFQCLIIEKDMDIYKRQIACLAYSLWFDVLNTLPDKKEDYPLYEWFLGSRNKGLIYSRIS